MENKKAAPLESAQQPGKTAFQSHANNNAESREKQGYRQTLRRWVKAFLVYLTCRQLLTERFANRIVGGLRHD
jgi:hypothetical protein